ncbi:hypothetical protein CLOHYLEM_06842 [[Clostridium] hylemonae DSM 15053]|uniref:Uncharacterized protein n=1 Tax=[Clostridium] hylemonae DSM 15053 TaxID=553973 RepID=C0C427_9FIRM|nr:hypothetical protein CLOHYLEM_06842 [[Clostridium] hylemonae DSM 15053]
MTFHEQYFSPYRFCEEYYSFVSKIIVSQPSIIFNKSYIFNKNF